MDIHIHIERLVLEGVNVPQHQEAVLQSTVETELANLVTAGSLNSSLMTAGIIPGLSGETFQLKGSSDAVQLGQQIALAVYKGIADEPG